MPLVSVVILTKNEEKNIGHCLEYLFNQTFKDFEVIVVDAHSTDRTVDIAKSYGCKIVFEERDKGKWGYGHARNLGIKNAKGELICFIDADIFLKDKKTLEKAIKDLHKYKADVVLAKIVFPDTVLGRYLSKPFHNELTTEWGKYTPHNRFMLAKKKSLYDVGLYDEEFKEGAEDLDLLYRMHKAGKRVVYDPSIIVYHNAGFSLNEWRKKAYRDGYTIARFRIKHNIKNNFICSKLYPLLASLYAGFFGIYHLKFKGIILFYYNFILAKERQKGYLAGLNELNRVRGEKCV